MSWRGTLHPARPSRRRVASGGAWLGVWSLALAVLLGVWMRRGVLGILLLRGAVPFAGDASSCRRRYELARAELAVRKRLLAQRADPWDVVSAGLRGSARADARARSGGAHFLETVPGDPAALRRGATPTRDPRVAAARSSARRELGRARRRSRARGEQAGEPVADAGPVTVRRRRRRRRSPADHGRGCSTRWRGRVVRMGLAVPAVFFLESTKPLSLRRQPGARLSASRS